MVDDPAALPAGRPGSATVGVLLAVALVARLPMAMLNLALLLLMRELGHSYAVAGGVAGASTVALGLAAPRIGRFADAHGAVPVLVATSVAGMACGVAMGAFPRALGVPGLALLAVVGGASSPPVATVFRAAVPRLVAPGETAKMYSLEAACQEMGYVVGPMLVMVLVDTHSARTAVVVCGLLTGLMGVTFAAAMRRHVAPPAAARRQGSVMANAALRRLLAAYCLMGGTFGAVEVGAVAALDHMGDRGASGVVLGVWAFGSLVGGLVVPRVWHAPPSVRLPILLGVLAILGIPLATMGTAGPAVLGAVLFAHGVAIAPTIGTVYELIPSIVGPEALTEAFSWSIGTVVVGSAAGMALSGLLTSSLDVRAALALAIAFPGAAALVRARPRGVPRQRAAG